MSESTFTSSAAADIVQEEFRKKQSAELQLADKVEFDAQVDQVQQSIEANNDIGNVTKTLIISKNDSIKRRVEQITTHFEQGQTNLLLVGKSSGIQKLISIVEIAKGKVKVVQCNKVMRQKSLINHSRPNVIAGKSTPIAETGEEAFSQAEIDRETAEVKGPKEYHLPVMYVFLFQGTEDDVAFGSGWTYQG